MEEKKEVTGESYRGFTSAADDAASQIGEDAGAWRVTEMAVEVEHHSPSHIQVFRVTLQKKS